jgi:hypothetical protein
MPAVPASSDSERWALVMEGAAMRKLMAALAVGMAVTGGSVAAAQNREDALTVTLHVTNYAAISPKDLAAAEAYATAIYRASGIQLVWTDTPWTPGETRSRHVRVVILSPDMTAKKCKDDQLGASVMGTAANEGTDGSSRIAYIFADRIGETALQYLAKFHRGLGHVMAHEVGHLLLGAHSHAPTGLMAISWRPLETHLQMLTPDQAHVIRVRAAATEE